MPCFTRSKFGILPSEFIILPSPRSASLHMGLKIFRLLRRLNGIVQIAGQTPIVGETRDFTLLVYTLNHETPTSALSVAVVMFKYYRPVTPIELRI